MSDELHIYSETRLSFEITLGTEPHARTFILKQNGGTWELSDATTGFWRNLGRRARWRRALDDALVVVMAEKAVADKRQRDAEG